MNKLRLRRYAYVWLALLVLAVWVVVLKLNVQTDLTGFLPASKNTLSETLIQELKGGFASRIILLGISGGTAPERAEASKKLRTALQESKQLKTIRNGVSIGDEALLGLVIKYRYLLGRGADKDAFSVKNLQDALAVRLEEMVSPMGALSKKYLARDPSGEILSLLEQYQSRTAIAKYHDVWVSRDGELALLVIETQSSGFDLRQQKNNVDTIRNKFAAVTRDDQSKSPLTLHMAGPAVFSVAASETISTEATVLSLVATLFVVLMLYWSYRSVRLLLLSVLPLLTGLVVAIAVVVLIFGGIHGIALAFGVTLIGITIDYPIHLYSHLNNKQSPAATIRAIWPTMRLCAISTAVGFGMMATTDIQGLSQLGVLIVVGLLAALLTTRFVLPDLLLNYKVVRGHTPRNWIVREPSRRAVLILNTTLAAGLISLLVWVVTPKWEQDLAALSPISESQRTLDKKLRFDLGAPETAHVIFVQANEIEMVLQRMELVEIRLDKLRSANVLSHFDMPSLYLPSRKKQLERRALLPETKVLSERLPQAILDTGFKASYFAPFIREVALSKTFPALEYEQIKDTVLGLRVGGLLRKTTAGWQGVVLISGLKNPAVLEKALDEGKIPGVQYFDIKQETVSVLKEFRDSAILRFALGAVLIVFIVALGLKSINAATRMASVVALAVVADIFILTVSGVQFTLFHLVALLLVVGLGVDYCLFFDRTQTSNEERAMTTHGVFLSMLSTVAVFGLLAFSTIPVLRAIGLTAAVGVVLVYLLAYAESPRLVKA